MLMKRNDVLASLLACLAAAGCGGNDDAPVLSAFQVTSAGELQLTDRRAIEYARVIAADTRGRFLFVSGGRRQSCGSPCHGPDTLPGFLRSYAIDAGSGVLSLRDERTMPYDMSYGSFHPSGRFLYAVQDGGIRTYALRPDGPWEGRGFVEGVTGDLVIVPSPVASPPASVAGARKRY